MAKRVQRLGHTTALADAFTGLARELTIDVSKGEIRLHDGFTLGGKAMGRADVSNVPAATAANDGKMTILQVNELLQAQVDIVANAAQIGINVGNIATNVVNIATAQAAADAKMLPIGAPTAGRLMIATADGQVLAQDAKLAADVATLKAGVKALFVQAAAPDGWTLDAAVNDRVLRISNSAGGGLSGSWPITGLSSAVIPDHVLTIGEMPSHDHPLTITQGQSGSGGTDSYARTGGAASAIGIDMSNRGGGNGHGHIAPAITQDGTWRPASLDAIVCSRNA